MLWGGRANVPFIPVPVDRASGILNEKGWLGDKRYSVVDCPFTGRSVILPTFQPDVGIIHVQRADAQGNAQTWGTPDFKSEVHLSCKKLIVTAEEIVDPDVIFHDPDRTMCPAFKVCAVVEVPWGAHPEAMYGHYDNDLAYRIHFEHSTYDDENTKKWMDEWVFGVKSREEYITHYIEKFGYSKLMRAQPMPFAAIRQLRQTETGGVLMKEKKYSTDYTLTELMLIWRRQVRDRDIVFIGTGLPFLACMLAKNTHPPHLVPSASRARSTPILSSGAHPRSIGDLAMTAGEMISTDLLGVMHRLSYGEFDLGFISGAQIDKYGNVNSTSIGNYKKLKVRFPGSGAPMPLQASQSGMCSYSCTGSISL